MIAPTRPSPATVPILAVLIIACADASPGTEAFSVRDSAGIRIVENEGAAQSDAWHVDTVPSVVIGGDESDSMHLLFRVTGAVVLSDGRIVIANGPPPMLRWYSANGAYETGTGRPGGGPGEFGGDEAAWISQLWLLPGDSIATWEHPPRRMQVFDPAGRYVRQVVLELPGDMPEGGYPQVIGRMGAGFAAMQLAPFRPGPVGEIRRDPMRYLRFGPDGRYLGTLAELPGFTRTTQLIRVRGREFPGEGAPLFASQPATWTHGDQFYYGPGDRYEIAILDTAGRLSALVRRRAEPMPVTDELIARVREESMSRAPDEPSARREWERSLEERPVADALPAHRRIRVDRTGRLWVQDYSLPGDAPSTWSIFDPDGRWLAHIRLPAAWEILDIGADYVLVLWRDALDVEHVRKHPLQRGR